MLLRNRDLPAGQGLYGSDHPEIEPSWMAKKNFPPMLANRAVSLPTVDYPASRIWSDIRRVG